MSKTKSKGRRRGGHNRGYYFRKGRGWAVGPRKEPLCFEDGRPIRDPRTPDAVLRAAYARWMLARDQQRAAAPRPGNVTVEQVVKAYLDHARHNGADQTFNCRSDTLYDFCYGLPPRFRKQPDLKPTRKDQVHPGLGSKLVHEVIPLDIDRWLQAHPTWKGGRKGRVQAVKRAFNYAVESGLIPASPLRGYKVPKARARCTYITDEQEVALLNYAPPKLALALRVLIRTGVRPGVEFAALEARHVRDHGDKMEWVFPAEETKTGRIRVVRITDPFVMGFAREQVRKYPEGKLARNSRHGPWDVKSMSRGFRRLLAKARSRGATFDPDTCLYSTRHTYAKRTLQGYWTGKPTNIETLARLMGNRAQTCRDYYLQWTETYNEPLWEAC